MLVDEGVLFQLLFEEDSQLELHELECSTTREMILAFIICTLRIQTILAQKFSNSKSQSTLKSEMAGWVKENQEKMLKFREYFKKPELEPDYK